jgi:UDP-N-acetylglucosamine--N-acetylmuramyl-(pentapeptide) pyrophosphoryl-undecaprenol N-acetylglucosamine transferase
MTDAPLHLLIAGGGTGGHLFPGLAVAEVARERIPGVRIRFVGGMRLEARVLTDAGWPFDTVAARPLPRRLGLGQFAALAVNAAGSLQALGLLRRAHPDAVLATGGYVCGPVGLAAVLLGIPLVLQEQNALPGLVNFWLARWAQAISVPAPMRGFPADRVAVTGVPVRPGVLQGDRRRARRTFGLEPERFTVLVLGGSQGALTLNRAIDEAATLMMYEPIQVLHQTGREHLEWVRKDIGHREHIGPPVIRQVALPFIEQMGEAYAASDLVLCRAGASTLAEVTAWGLPAILVPYPYAAGAHQDANARRLAEAGAAEVIPDASLTGLRLAEVLRGFLQDPGRREAMAEGSRSLARPDAAERVLDLLLLAARRRPMTPAPVSSSSGDPTPHRLGASGRPG